MGAPAKPLALTFGEPAGIGPEIALASWLKRDQAALPPFYLLGDAAALARRAKRVGLNVPLAEVGVSEAVATFDRALPVVDIGVRVTAEPGQPDASSAPAAITAITRAVADVTAGRAGAVVTNPIAKSVLYAAGFKHPGHTEFLAELASSGGAAPHPVMMLWSETLSVVPVTIHLPLREAIAALTTELIVKTCQITAADLSRRFGLARPRLAISGLNPHAGEDGSLGTEDQNIIAPAVAALRASGHRRPRSAAGRHHVPCRRAQDLRLRDLHVSRPGADPAQDAGLRRRRQRHARPAVRAHLARSRHRLRHRRHRPAPIRRA